MFVDLVGSTALSAQLDPEDMRELIRSYQNTVAGEISRFEGHIAQFLGDGVLAYFGWPRAHEDDAERAVRSALAVTAAASRLKTGMAGTAATSPTAKNLQTRIGIATGVVVVGDLIGEGSGQRHAVVGETPNFAARLQGIAEPGMVVIADSTRHLAGDLFVLRDLGAQTFKGIAQPASVFAVLGERALESRFAARHAGEVTAIVGRDQELALLVERWRQAKARRRSSRVAQRRGRDRQVTHHGSRDRRHAQRATLPAALPMFAVPRGLGALPGDPAALACGRLHRRRRHAAPPGTARGAVGHSDGRCQRDGSAHGRAIGNRCNLALRREHADAAAAPQPHTGGADRPAHRPGPAQAGALGGRRRALDRPDDAGAD